MKSSRYYHLSIKVEHFLLLVADVVTGYYIYKQRSKNEKIYFIPTRTFVSDNFRLSKNSTNGRIGPTAGKNNTNNIQWKSVQYY